MYNVWSQGRSIRGDSLWERARGRWPAILRGIGIPAEALRNVHCPCPVCGGKDRFRFDDLEGNGTWICNRCGAGNGVDLAKAFLSMDFRNAALAIEKQLDKSLLPALPTNSRVRADHRNDSARRLWDCGRAITPGDAAGRYLTKRLGISAFSGALRFVPHAKYVDGATRLAIPAMIARFEPCSACDVDQTFAVHRTFLTSAGAKADVGCPRKVLGRMPRGGAVRLMPHSEVLGIAEGIETAIAASMLFSEPVWAALTANLLQTWEPPPEVNRVLIFADNDLNMTGQHAAAALARRLQARGLAVRLEIPTLPGRDWDDVRRLRNRVGDYADGTRNVSCQF